jgi:hypothetical protein
VVGRVHERRRVRGVSMAGRPATAKLPRRCARTSANHWGDHVRDLHPYVRARTGPPGCFQNSDGHAWIV